MIYPLRGVKIPTFLRHFCVLKSPVLTFRILTPLTPGFGGGYPVYQKVGQNRVKSNVEIGIGTRSLAAPSSRQEKQLIYSKYSVNSKWNK